MKGKRDTVPISDRILLILSKFTKQALLGSFQETKCSDSNDAIGTFWRGCC